MQTVHQSRSGILNADISYVQQRNININNLNVIMASRQQLSNNVIY